ncbi:hypothetical protein C8Q77DRAFT_1149242 [Trametes polyzona]|nr:hypothetical protein C8Q77DRAFT_1149242 [Trametes polyzona]
MGRPTPREPSHWHRCACALVPRNLRNERNGMVPHSTHGCIAVTSRAAPVDRPQEQLQGRANGGLRASWCPTANTTPGYNVRLRSISCRVDRDVDSHALITPTADQRVRARYGGQQ